jgi:rod shape-determining protein MreB
MFSKFINKFTTTFYIQIWDNRLKVTNLNNGNTYDDIPLIAISNEKIQAIGKDVSVYPHAVNPFSHKRVLFDNFDTASMIIRYAFEQTIRRNFFSPIAIVQVKKQLESQLTSIEQRALCEVMTNAGARETIIYDGVDLDMETIDYEKLREISFCCEERVKAWY